MAGQKVKLNIQQAHREHSSLIKLCSFLKGKYALLLGKHGTYRLWAEIPGVRMPVGVKDLSSFLNIQSAKQGRRASYSMGTGGSFPGDKAA
jgi:hypothetical protein